MARYKGEKVFHFDIEQIEPEKESKYDHNEFCDYMSNKDKKREYTPIISLYLLCVQLKNWRKNSFVTFHYLQKDH